MSKSLYCCINNCSRGEKRFLLSLAGNGVASNVEVVQYTRLKGKEREAFVTVHGFDCLNAEMATEFSKLVVRGAQIARRLDAMLKTKKKKV